VRTFLPHPLAAEDAQRACNVLTGQLARYSQIASTS
jgi:hypothetical protein